MIEAAKGMTETVAKAAGLADPNVGVGKIARLKPFH
jgi:hypothetical protein